MLFRQLILEAPAVVRNANGEVGPQATTWNTVATLRATIETLSGRQLELAQAATITATATHKIIVRYRQDLRIGFHRLRYGAPGWEDMTDWQWENLGDWQWENLNARTRIFTINAINDPDMTHLHMVLTCTEVKA